MGLLLPELGLSQDPGLIAIGKVKPFNFITQPNYTTQEILPKTGWFLLIIP